MRDTQGDYSVLDKVLCAPDTQSWHRIEELLVYMQLAARRIWSSLLHTA